MRIVTFLILNLFIQNAFASNCYHQLDKFISKVYDQEIELDKMDLHMQFFSKYVQFKSDQEIKALNELMIGEMNDLPRFTNNSLPLFRIEEIFQSIKSRKVIQKSCGEVNSYDPHNQVGFCFGRAMLSHFEALKYKVDKRSILKIWLVGDFKNAHWNHHVAVTLRGDDDNWYVLDPLFEQTFTIKEYLDLFNNKFGNRLALVPSSPKRFLSAKAIKDSRYAGYEKKHLYHDFSSLEIFWKEFFTDLIEEIRYNR